MSLSKNFIFLFFLFSFFGVTQAQEELQNDNLVLKNLYSTEGKDTISDDADLPLITLPYQELEEDDNNVESISPLLQSSRDVFSQVMSFDWGNYFVRTRNLGNRDAKILINGVEMNESISGTPVWRNWGGLNQIMRFPDIKIGLEPLGVHLGSINGVSQYSTQASQISKQFSSDISLSNRNSYQYRFMLTYATGLRPKGWAFVTSFSGRLGGEPFFQSAPRGGILNAYSLFLGVEKEWEEHSLSLSMIGAYFQRGASAVALTQEVKNLYGIYYNPYWGYQEGRIRNERVRTDFQPIIQFVHEWNIHEMSSLTTTLSWQIGTEGNTRIERFNQPSSSPIYYKYLPSYAVANNNPLSTISIYDETNLQENYPVQGRQINWYYLYKTNAALNARGLPAGYILSENIEDNCTIAVTSTYKNQIAPGLVIYGTLAMQNNLITQYARVNDLLGAAYVKNVDVFNNVAKDKYQSSSLQLKVGDKIDYHAVLLRDYVYLHVLGEFSLNKLEAAFGARIAYTRMQREGKFWNGLYANENTSFGKSDYLHFWLPTVKAMLLYKVVGHHQLKLNLAYSLDAPTLRESFPNGRYENSYYKNIKPIELIAGDFSYLFQSSKFNVRVTAYGILRHNEMNVLNYFVQTSTISALLTEFLTDVRTRSMGVEAALRYPITPSWQATVAAHVGEHVYTHNPTVITFGQRADESFGEQNYGTSMMKNLRVANGPQQSYHLGLQYTFRFWRFGMSANYIASSFIQPSAIKRTESFALNLQTGNAYVGYTEELARQLLKQEEFQGGFYFNLNVSKSWRLNYKYSVGFNLMLNNLTNNLDIVTSGYEQSRYVSFPEAYADAQRENPLFGNRYWYNQGLTAFLNIFFRF